MAASDDSYFSLKLQCHHSFKKNDPPHNLKVALCIVNGEVEPVLPVQLVFFNHVLVFMMKVCKFTLYQCKSISDLDNESDMKRKQACTSILQQWYRKGRGDTIVPQHL